MSSTSTRCPSIPANHTILAGAFELIHQEKEQGFVFDTIIVSCASGSTLGGMIAGFKLAEKLSTITISPDAQPKLKNRRLIGIQAMTQPKEEITQLVLDIARQTATLLDIRPDDITGDEFEVDDRFNAGQYGRLDDKTTQAIKTLASLEGILTDPVYTGKALAGMLHMAKEGELRKSQNVLFVHTGGAPAMSAYPELK